MTPYKEDVEEALYYTPFTKCDIGLTHVPAKQLIENVANIMNRVILTEIF